MSCTKYSWTSLTRYKPCEFTTNTLRTSLMEVRRWARSLHCCWCVQAFCMWEEVTECCKCKVNGTRKCKGLFFTNRHNAAMQYNTLSPYWNVSFSFLYCCKESCVHAKSEQSPFLPQHTSLQPCSSQARICLLLSILFLPGFADGNSNIPFRSAFLGEFFFS